MGAPKGDLQNGGTKMAAPKWGPTNWGLQCGATQTGSSKLGLLKLGAPKWDRTKWGLPNGTTQTGGSQIGAAQTGGSPRGLPSTAAEGGQGPAASCCQSPVGAGHSSSRAVLSRGDCSTSEFLASLRSSCCSFIFWDLARSQSVLIFSSFHTTEVSVSLM